MSDRKRGRRSKKGSWTPTLRSEVPRAARYAGYSGGVMGRKSKDDIDWAQILLTNYGEQEARARLRNEGHRIADTMIARACATRESMRWLFDAVMDRRALAKWEGFRAPFVRLGELAIRASFEDKTFDFMPVLEAAKVLINFLFRYPDIKAAWSRVRPEDAPPTAAVYRSDGERELEYWSWLRSQLTREEKEWLHEEGLWSPSEIGLSESYRRVKRHLARKPVRSASTQRKRNARAEQQRRNPRRRTRKALRRR